MEENSPPTEREKYEQALEDKLKKAGKAKRFLEHEDGALVTEWLTTQINTLLKQVAGKSFISRPINDKDGNVVSYVDATLLKSEYDYTVGQLHGYQKLLTMLNSEAQQNTAELTEKLNASKSDQ